MSDGPISSTAFGSFSCHKIVVSVARKYILSSHERTHWTVSSVKEKAQQRDQSIIISTCTPLARQTLVKRAIAEHCVSISCSSIALPACCIVVVEWRYWIYQIVWRRNVNGQVLTLLFSPATSRTRWEEIKADQPTQKVSESVFTGARQLTSLASNFQLTLPRKRFKAIARVGISFWGSPLCPFFQKRDLGHRKCTQNTKYL